MYIKKILWIIAIAGLLAGGFFAYMVYTAIFTPNTKFNNAEAFVYVASDASFSEVKTNLEPLLKDMESFEAVAKRKGYTSNIKAGKYRIGKGMNNNEIVNSLRSGNIPVKVSFNNQETLAMLAGRIAVQIEPDSISLLNAFNDTAFLHENNFSDATKLAMYIPNSYEFFWNTSPKQFRARMLKEYNRFWNRERLKKAEALNLKPAEVVTLASIVHKESAKVDERPRVAGVYLNRLRQGILLQADPTVIYALKLHSGDFDQVIKRVLYKDLELDSPYNTYKYAGLPPGPIAMPDISAIDAVLNPEKHEYLYFVANVERFGYHKFAKTLAQHNRNKVQYIRWINQQNINR
ncbi:endolytic transglycosylase MltG [Costertonia aggregata]|uniref:Endolytic murein transglycosylase n=1 Tax=Costertonia aggregata TaxID=343403 RepID=A0A7H9AK07_9FLAO|nr:endolytic transglycosylase MltG [Costertonia aggregata]QLG43871.1 endolytic transglycosylase MltG [Costertonia aggregata]